MTCGGLSAAARLQSILAEALGAVLGLAALDDRLLGLAPLRREVAVGDEVDAGGRRARVVGLPFGAEDLDG